MFYQFFSGLLEIAARTIALIHRNNIFQQKVDALRYETQDYYIKSSIYKKDKKNRNDRVSNAVTSSIDRHETRDDNTKKHFDDEIIRSNQVTSSTYIYSDSDSDNDSTSDHESDR